MTSEDVRNLVEKRFELHLNAINKQDENVSKLESEMRERVQKIESEMNTLRTQLVVKARIMGTTPDNMTPFAQRHPVSGGNKSPQ